MSDPDSTLTARMGWGLFGFFTSPLRTLWDSYCVCRLWRWFAEPLGAPHIVLWQAAGLSVLVALIRANVVSGAHRSAVEMQWSSDMKLHDIRGIVLGAWLAPTFMLGIGWIIQATAAAGWWP